MLEQLIRNYDTQLRNVREAQEDNDKLAGGTNVDVRGRMMAFLNQSLMQTEREWLAAKSQLGQAKLRLAELEKQQKNLDREQVSELAITKALAQNKTIVALKEQIATWKCRSIAPPKWPAAARRTRPSYGCRSR